MATQHHPEPQHPELQHPEPQHPEPPESAGSESPDNGVTTDAEERDALEASVAALEDRWRRTLADLDNLRKRYARELDRERAEERKKVATAWLPLLDHLEMALEHAEADPGSIVEGVRAVRDQAVRLLADLGYPRDEDVGVPFDPERHEVVSIVDAPAAEPGTVVRMLRPGYGTADRQLRPGSVAVAGRRE